MFGIDDRGEFLKAWQLLGERLFLLKAIYLVDARGFTSYLVAERERSGSREKEVKILEEILQIAETVHSAVELLQSAESRFRECASAADLLQAEQWNAMASALQAATPAGSA
ncbi:hypothetical protein [Bradyrhizobium sp. USDA 4454]